RGGGKQKPPQPNNGTVCISVPNPMPKIRPTVLFLFDLCAGYSEEFPRPQGGPFEASCSPPSSPCCPIVNPKIVSRPPTGSVSVSETCRLRNATARASVAHTWQCHLMARP